MVVDGGPDGGTASGTAVLTTIPRKSTITAIDANIESATTINISRASNSFTHTITWSFSDLSGTIATKTSETSLGWTIPSSFYAKIPNSKTGTVTLTCTTYNGNTSLGSTTTTFTASVPTSGTHDSSPIISTAEIETTVTRLTGDSKRIIPTYGQINLSLTGSCLNYAEFYSLIEGGDYSLTPTTSTSEGTTSLTVTNERIYSSRINRLFNDDKIEIVLIDSRNLSTTKILSVENGDFTVVPYILPTLNVNIQRTSPTSDDIIIRFNGNFYNGYFDIDNENFNNLYVDWRYKEKGGAWNIVDADDTVDGWRYLTLGTDYQYVQNQNQFESIGDITIQNLFDYQKDYVIEVRLEDETRRDIIYTVTINKGIPYFDYGEDSNGENYFNVNGKIYSNNYLISELDISNLTENEYPTNEFVDGELVYRKRIIIGQLPNNTTKDVLTNIDVSNLDYIHRIEGICYSPTNLMWLPIPFAYPASANCIGCVCYINNNNLYVRITTGMDRTSITESFVDIYYTKRN